MQGMPEDDALLTPSEVAAMFRVNPKTVTRWARAGKISAIRTLGGHRQPSGLIGQGRQGLTRRHMVAAHLDAQGALARSGQHVIGGGGFAARVGIRIDGGAAGPVRHVLQHTEDVGEGFVKEVRNIHRGDATQRAVRGQADQEEVAELKDNINTMIGNLRGTTDRNQEQDWLKTNLARFTRLLQGQRDFFGAHTYERKDKPRGEFFHIDWPDPKRPQIKA